MRRFPILLLVVVVLLLLVIIATTTISALHKHTHNHDHDEKLRKPPLREQEKPKVQNHNQKSSKPFHKCMHDDPDHQAIINKHLSETPVNPHRPNLARDANPLAVAGLRVVYSDADLNISSQYCVTVGESKPDFKGSTTTCRSQDILTNAKRTVLTTKVLPAAIGLINNMLSMESLTSNIIVPQTACTGLGYTIPSSHSTTGVPNADYVLYISAGRTPDGVLAFAGACGYDAAGRIIYGRANFGPEYLVWDDNNPAGNDDMIKTAVHEIFHALGFSYSTFQSKGLTTSVSVRGKTTNGHTGAIGVANAKTFFNCPSLTYVELEDEGGAGSANSHPDKRLFPKDFMAASGGSLISTTSIGMLADLGYYTPLYGQVQNATFGRDAGCNFISQKCNTAGGGANNFFCFDSSLVDVCNYDFTASGYCGVNDYSSDLPAYFQYFSGLPRKGGQIFYDYCPVIESYSNRICNGERVAPYIDYVLGFTFARQSRCFRSEGVVRSGFGSGGLGNTRCLVSQCIDNGAGGKSIQFKINGSAWLECAIAGESISGLPGYDGRIICPDDFTKFCDWYNKVPAPPDGYPESYAGSGADGTDQFNQIPTRSGAIVWIVGELVFIGLGWKNVNGTVPIPVVQALQRDIAQLIGINVREAFITEAHIEPKGDGTSERVLRIRYYITNTGITLETVTGRFDNVRNQNSTAWSSRTRTAYAEASGAFDAPLLRSHEEHYELSYLERLFLGLAIGPFSGIVVAGFIFCCIVVAIFFYFCKDSCCPKDNAHTDDNFGGQKNHSPLKKKENPVQPRQVQSKPVNGGYRETMRP